MALPGTVALVQLKKVTLEEIDTKIINAMEGITVLEEEIYEAEEYKTILIEKITFLQNFISLSVTTQVPSPTSPQPQIVTPEQSQKAEFLHKNQLFLLAHQSHHQRQPSAQHILRSM